MKKYARSFVIALVAFLAVAHIYPGFSYDHDLKNLLLAAVVFAFLTIFIKPVLKMLSLPFNLLTFGLFSFIINALVLYGVAYAVPYFKIVGFHFSGLNVSGFNLPAADLNQLLSALIASFVIGFIATIMQWIFH